MFSIDLLTKYLLKPILTQIENIIKLTITGPCDEVYYEASMTSLLNKINSIYNTTNEFKNYETKKYYDNKFSYWNKQFKTIYKSQQNESIDNIRKQNKLVLERLEDNLLNKDIIFLKTCHKNKEFETTKVIIFQETNFALLQIIKLKNLNKKSKIKSIKSIKSIIKETQNVIKKMTTNIANILDKTIEPTNQVLCMIKQRIEEKTTDQYQKLNDILIEINNTNFMNFNSQTTSVQSIREIISKNDTITDVDNVIKKFNDNLNKKHYNWETFKNNNRERFDKDKNYRKVLREEPERFKETINIVKTWILQQKDIYQKLYQHFLKNGQKINDNFNDDFQIDNFIIKLNQIITAFKNITTAIDRIFIANPAEFKPTINKYLPHLQNSENKELHKQKQQNIEYKNLKNILSEKIEKDLISKLLSFQDNELATLQTEILNYQNHLVIDSINSENQKQEITQLINEFNCNLAKTNNISELKIFCLNTINKIQLFINSNKINQEKCKKEIRKMVQEFNLKINILPEKNIDSYNDIVSQFINNFSTFKNYFKTNNNFYAKQKNRKLNQLIDLAKNNVKNLNDLQNFLIHILNEIELIFDQQILIFISDLERFNKKIMTQNKKINDKSSIINITANLNYVLNDLNLNTNFIFGEQWHEIYNKQLNSYNKTVTVTLTTCEEYQDWLAYKCSKTPLEEPTTTLNTISNSSTTTISEVYKRKPLLNNLDSRKDTNFNYLAIVIALTTIATAAASISLVTIKKHWNKNSATDCNTLDNENRETKEQQIKLISQTSV